MTVDLSRARRTRRARIAAGAAALAFLASACGGSDSGSSAPKNFSFLNATENSTVEAVLQALGNGACKTQQEALPLKTEAAPQSGLDQKVQLLAGQDALPVQFAASTPELIKQLDRSGKVADLEGKLTELGVMDQLQPGSVATIKALYGGKLAVLPYEYNIEGIFYNKKLFADHGLAVPGTWDELVAAADKLNAADVQPFAASGQQGWPITRFLSGYLYRSLGPDALKDVAEGRAKLTDPQYVAAAEKVVELGKKGYFGQGVGSIDYDTAMNQFLNGKAGMFYMGSWALANISDPEQNKVGADNIGFMPFPAVTGGKGTIDQYPANVGLSMTLSAKSFDAKVGDWTACIAKNYGATALQNKSTISGFKVNASVSDPNVVTGQVRNKINGAQQTVLWFEALFSAKATDVSQKGAASLITGSTSPKEFMQNVQNALAGS